MSTIWPDTGTSACLGPVRSEPVRNGFSNMMTPLNLEPDRRSGSAQGMNLEPNHGPVRLGSGSDHGSEPNLTTPRAIWDFVDDPQIILYRVCETRAIWDFVDDPQIILY